MWKIDPKDKHTHKNKQDHIQTYMQKMFAIVGLLYVTGEGGKGIDNDKKSTISKYVTSVQVENRMMCTESC
jgi:hypothetical protein